MDTTWDKTCPANARLKAYTHSMDKGSWVDTTHWHMKVAYWCRNARPLIRQKSRHLKKLQNVTGRLQVET